MIGVKRNVNATSNRGCKPKPRMFYNAFDYQPQSRQKSLNRRLPLMPSPERPTKLGFTHACVIQ